MEEESIMAKKMVEVKKVFFRNVNGLTSSPSGNPRYEADMVLSDGSTIYGKTATDADAAYGFRKYAAYQAQIAKEFEGETWYRTIERVPCYADVKYHETANGNIIFDYVRDHVEVA